MDQREEGEETNRRAKRVAHMEEVLHPSIYRRRGAAAPRGAPAPRGCPHLFPHHVGGHSTHKLKSPHN